jgi:hypothetical protein
VGYGQHANPLLVSLRWLTVKNRKLVSWGVLLWGFLVWLGLVWSVWLNFPLEGERLWSGNDCWVWYRACASEIVGAVYYWYVELILANAGESHDGSLISNDDDFDGTGTIERIPL